VLSGVSCRMEPGVLSALVGASGCGKTTLFDLIVGLYVPERGRILIGGRDTQTMSVGDLRSAAGLVSQEPHLFRGTIRENLECARPGTSLTTIERACRLANIVEYIHSLPEGYDTVIGDGGVRLSAGQRHRLALARAVLGDQPILLCDEVSAALDVESERLIGDSLRALASSRTVVFIAHRPSMIWLADHVVVLDGGRVAAAGTHSHLLRTSTLYHRLTSPSLDVAPPACLNE